MFKVNDKVLVYHDDRDPSPRVETVHKAHQKYVVLSDGSRFSRANGREWDGESYAQRFIELATTERLAQLEEARQEREDKVRATRLRDGIGRYLTKMGIEDLDALYAFLRERGMSAVVE